MKSKLTKILCLVMGAILLVTGTVAVTLAYLTSIAGPVKNTMSVGNVTITLDEAKVTVYGAKDGNSRVKANTYKLIPGQEYIKDPLITVAKGSEPCYVFFGLYIDPSVSGVLVDNATQGIEKQLSANGWLPLKSGESQLTWTGEDGDDDEGIVYKIYYKSDAVNASSAAKPLKTFEKFAVATDADVSGANTKLIVAKAFAVQSANLGTPANAWDKAFKQSAG